MCNRAKIVEGIVIGIGGGAGAGLVICGISYLREKWLEKSRHKKRLYKWLEKGKNQNCRYAIFAHLI